MYTSILLDDDRGAPKDPLPVVSNLPRIKVVAITPVTIDVAQNAKNTDAIAALSVSIRSGAAPAQSEGSNIELAA